MLSSVSELKLLKSFRIPVEEADNVRFYIECKNEADAYVPVNSAKLLDLSISGLCFTTKERFKLGTDFKIYLQFKKHKVDVSGKVVRSYSYNKNEESSAYGIEFAPDEDVNKFLEQLILSFSYDRLRDCMVDKVLSEKTNSIHDGLEIFSLILSLFKDIMKFGKQSEFLESLLEEVTNVMNAQRATVFLINPDKNELEAIIALGTDKNVLHFDYRLGIAGSVFTTGVALNLDNVQQSSRFSNEFDAQTGFVTRSIICNPIYNREDKIIGVVEILNKRNQDQFTFEDEKIMKVVSLILSTVFHNYNPVSEVSQIRRFSTPFDRQHVLIGKSQYIENLRKSIIKLKDLDSAMLIEGENGSGKNFMRKLFIMKAREDLLHLKL
ncbi:MAG: GAF domain-containing protein [Bacteriovoracaceae bacterium]